jgi:hypothetical protein
VQLYSWREEVRWDVRIVVPFLTILGGRRARRFQLRKVSYVGIQRKKIRATGLVVALAHYSDYPM